MPVLRPGTPLPRAPRAGFGQAWDAPATARRAVRYDAPADPRTTRVDTPAAPRTVMRTPAARIDGRLDAPAPRATSTRGWIA